MNQLWPNLDPCQVPMTRQDAQLRRKNSIEVLAGYSADEARLEAARCLDCPERHCVLTCPMGVPIPEFISRVREGDFEDAYQVVKARNPFLGITSRVCPSECQCQLNCTRGIRNEPVNIPGLERFVYDTHRATSTELHTAPDAVGSSGRSVGVVGGGPAGLMCALELARHGIAVTVYDRSERFGGILTWGVPAFVLPPEVLDDLVADVAAAGVQLVGGRAMDADLNLDDLLGRHDAVFVGIGASKPVDLPADLGAGVGVVQAGDYLAASQAERPRARQVVVIGGGNTAMDAARVALRSGAERVVLAYRRTRAELPASPSDVLLGLEEGVELVELVQPHGFRAGESGLDAVAFEVMELGAADYPGGRPNPVPTGEVVEVEAGLAILALGYENQPVPGLSPGERNRVQVDASGATSRPGVFAAGDTVSGPTTVARAAGAGRAAAESILEFLAARS